jgi:hypothetical protein
MSTREERDGRPYADEPDLLLMGLAGQGVGRFDVEAHRSRCFVTRSAGGLIQANWCSAHFVDLISALPADFTPQDYLRHPGLLLHSEGPLQVFFTPFDHLPHDAKVLLVGLTPGLHQAHLALTTCAAHLRTGADLDVALTEASRVGGFAGTMRANNAAMIDGIGLNQHLGLTSCAELFGEHRHLMAGTSALCYPVFVKGANYGGGTPPLPRSPILRAFASQVLATELAAFPDTLIVPLGRAAETAVALTGIASERVLAGFPHPSGANGHRAKSFHAGQRRLAKTVDTWFASG